MSYISLPLREINLKRWCKVGFDQNMQDILCVCVCVCVCVCYMTYILCGGSRRKGGRTDGVFRNKSFSFIKQWFLGWVDSIIKVAPGDVRLRPCVADYLG